MPRPSLSAPFLRPLLAAASILLIFPGCASSSRGPALDSQMVPPEAWSGVDAEATGAGRRDDLATWWERFDDPVLTRLVLEAQTRNPDIRIALSRVAQARALRAVETSRLLPTLDANLEGQETRRRERRGDTSTVRENYSATLDASWEIDLFGRQALERAAAGADLAQSEENGHAARVTLAAEIALAYFRLRSAEAQLAVLRRSLAGREETSQLTRWREEAGLGDILDSRQALRALEQARAAIPPLHQDATEARHQLAVLCGRNPGEPAFAALLEGPASTPRAPALPTLGIPAETLSQRPDLRAAVQAVEAASARAAAARRERLPSLRLSGSLGVEAGELGRLASPNEVVGSLAGGLTAPIFAAGRITQTIRVRDEDTRQALIAYEAAVLEALAETENALEAVRRGAERLSALDRAAAAAREADELARRRYEAGAIDFLQVLEAERSLLEIEQSLVITRADLGSAHVRLYKSLGGGWSPNEPAPVAQVSP